MESILNDVKKASNIGVENKDFDPDVILYTNGVLWRIAEAGVGQADFSVRDETQTWQDFVGAQIECLEGVKTYVCLKVKLIFDPPTSSAVLESMRRIINEYEWLLNVAGDKKG